MINFVNFFDLIVEEFKNFLFTLAFRGQSVGAFLRTADGETFNLPPVLDPNNQLDLALESEAQCETLVRPVTYLQLKIELLKFAEVLL